MKSAIVKLGKHTLIYGFGNIGSQLIAFLLLPLYVKYLTPADYGVLQICNVFHAILLIILQMGLTSALFKVYYQEDDVMERRVILSSTIFFNICSSLILLSILYLFRSVLAPIAVGEQQSEILFTLVLGAVFFEAVNTLGLSILRAEEKSTYYALFSIAKIVFYAILNVLFVAYLKRGYLGAREAVLITMAAGFSVFIPILYKRFVFTIRWSYIKELLQLGIPLAIGGLATWILNFTDRYMLMHLLPEGEAMTQVGIYSLGAKFAMLIKILIVAPFTLSWGALMFAYQKDEKAKELYAKVLNLFAFVGAIAFFFISIYGGDIIRVMSSNSDYLQAYMVIPFLSLSYALYGIYMVLTVGVTLAKKTYYISITNLIAASFNIILNYFLIQKMGMMGAVISSLISFTIMTILLYHFAQRVYKIPYQMYKVSSMFALLALIIALLYYFQIGFLSKTVLFIIILLLLPKMQVVSYKELRKFYETLKEFVMFKLGALWKKS